MIFCTFLRYVYNDDEDCENAKHVAIRYHHKKEKVINQKIRTYIKDVGEMPDEAYTRRQTDEKTVDRR